ncbi:MAG TPA: DNA primase [candidate division Zixibacteria bacterium]|nr:DNA primase [candidate division Zixibacteria bacterium]
MGYIPEDIVEKVREATDITEVISGFVKLRRRGRNMIGLCPFHEEKTPSFTVSPDKQIFHCFGCGQGGNVYRFLMEHEKLSFPETVRHLAAKAGVTVPETGGAPRDQDEIDKLYYAHQLAADFFAHTLRQTAHRDVYVDYLQKTRGISEETITHFGLGVAPDSSRAFIEVAQKRGLTPDALIKAGLAGRGERGDLYDRFRRRLMIPIAALSDKIIAFGGRALRAEEHAKYINSPETPLYSKSNVLYGLNLTRNAIRDSGSVIIVEGYFDLISLWQCGVRNVVASSGTAFTPQQGRLLARFADKAYLFFDADSAGVKAAIRSVDSLYNAGVEVSVVSAPPGEDPDSVARQGADRINELLKSAERYLQFRLRDFKRSGAGLVERNQLIGELGALAGKIADPALRALFTQEAAELLGVDTNIILLKTAAPDTSQPTPVTSGVRALSEDDWGARGEQTLEAELLSLLLAHPNLITSARQRLAPDLLQSAKLRNLYTHMCERLKATSGDAAGFIGGLDDEQARRTATFLATRRWDTPAPETTLKDYIETILTSVQKRPSISALKDELKAAERAGDSAAAERLTEEILQRLAE